MSIRPLVPVLVLVACAGGEDPAAGGVDAFLRGLPTWSEYSPPVAEAQGPTAAPEVQTDEVAEDGTGYRCTTTEHDLATNPDEIAMASPDAAVLWPGALLHGDAHRDEGALRLLALRRERRAPLSISLQGGGLLGIPGGVSTTIDQPIGSTVREGINQVVAQALAADVAPGVGTSSFTMVETHSSEQALLEMGFDARYLGASASGSLAESSSFEQSVVTATFVQRLFTVAVDPPEAPGDLFDDAVQASELAELGISDDNLPLYIDSVAYGRLLFVTMRSSDSVEQLQAALDFSYDSPIGGVSGYGATELQATLSSAEVEVFALGGPNAGVEALISSGRLADYFESELQINQVEPISFTLRNLGDNTLATVADTTSYSVQTCEAVDGALVQPIHHWTADGHTDDEIGDHDLGGFGGNYGAGISGQAWSFEGEYSYLLNHLAPLPVPDQSAFTISAWVYPRSESKYLTIASQLGAFEGRGDFSLRLAPGGVLQFFRRPVDWYSDVDLVVSGGGAVPMNTWTHVTGVYGTGPDGEGSLRVYVDGVLASDAAFPSTYASTRGDTYFRVGSSELGPQEGDKLYLFEGDMDELKIYDTALSSDEVFLAITP